MYRAPLVASAYLDIAEKSRAYERHTHALLYNVHHPISTPPDIAPSIAIYRRRRDAEREKTIAEDKKHSKTIDYIFKKQHNIPIPDDVTQLRKSDSTRNGHAGTARPHHQWSSLLKEKEQNFPSNNERKFGNSHSLKRVDFHNDSQQSTFREPESGMRVNYNSKSSRPRTTRTNKRRENNEQTTNKQNETSGMQCDDLVATKTNQEPDYLDKGTYKGSDTI